MNRWLPSPAVIGGFPLGPVKVFGEFGEDASGMNVGDDFIELGLKQDDLLAWLRSSGPVSIFHATIPEVLATRIIDQCIFIKSTVPKPNGVASEASTKAGVFATFSNDQKSLL